MKKSFFHRTAPFLLILVLLGGGWWLRRIAPGGGSTPDDFVANAATLRPRPPARKAAIIKADPRAEGLNFDLESSAPYKLFTAPQIALRLDFSKPEHVFTGLNLDIAVLDFDGQTVFTSTSTLGKPDATSGELKLPNFSLPRLGWYQIFLQLRQGKDVLVERVHFIGRTMADEKMPIPAAQVSGWDDLGTHQMTGMGLHRFSLQTFKQIDQFEGPIKEARAKGIPYFVLFIRPEDVTPEGTRYVLEKLKQFGDNAPKIELVNEPNLNMSASAYIGILKRSYATIRQTNPKAQIMGPSQCGIELNWFEDFFKAGGGDFIDIVSVHTYERNNSMDVYHWSWKFGRIQEIMAKYKSADKPLYQTEHGYLGFYFEALLRPQWQARETLLEQNTLDRFGMTRDKNFYYYVNEGGYRDHSAYIVDRQRELYPVVLMTRARTHFLKNQKFTRALDFGAPGNWLLLGNEYSGATGNTEKVVSLQNCGSLQDVVVQFTGVIRGAAPRIFDCFGNEQKWQTTLQVGRYPLYVVLPKDLAWQARIAPFGREIGGQARITADDAKGQASTPRLTNGLLEFDFHNQPERVGFLASDGKLPLELTFEWTSPQQISRAILYGSLSDNDKSTPLEYDVLARSGGKWNKIDEVRVAPSEQIFAAGTIPKMTDYDNPWIFQHNLAGSIAGRSTPVVADALRFRFLKTTHGQVPTTELAKTLLPKLPQRVELREIQIFAP